MAAHKSDRQLTPFQEDLLCEWEVLGSESRLKVDERLTEFLLEQIEPDTPWYRLYLAKRHEIRTQLGDEMRALRESRPLPTLSFLHAKVDLREADRYRDEVDARWQNMRQGIDALAQSVRQSLAGMPRGVLRGDHVESSFFSFTEDLQADLDALSRRMEVVPGRVRDTRCKARLCDAVARRYEALQEASRFACLVAEHSQGTGGDR